MVEGTDLNAHFQKLAQRFPLQTFEKSMGEFIQMILDSMDIPALDMVNILLFIYFLFFLLFEP